MERRGEVGDTWVRRRGGVVGVWMNLLLSLWKWATSSEGTPAVFERYHWRVRCVSTFIFILRKHPSRAGWEASF